VQLTSSEYSECKRRRSTCIHPSNSEFTTQTTLVQTTDRDLQATCFANPLPDKRPTCARLLHIGLPHSHVDLGRRVDVRLCNRLQREQMCLSINAAQVLQLSDLDCVPHPTCSLYLCFTGTAASFTIVVPRTYQQWRARQAWVHLPHVVGIGIPRRNVDHNTQILHVKRPVAPAALLLCVPHHEILNHHCETLHARRQLTRPAPPSLINRSDVLFCADSCHHAT